MKRLIALATPDDPPALHQWREHALTLMMRMIVLAPLPAIALDLSSVAQQGISVQIVAELLTYAIIVPMALSRRIPYQWRTFYVLSANLIFTCYLLVNMGLVSNGRVYLIATTAIAALMLSRRSVVVVWLCGVAALMINGMAFAGQPPAVVAPVMQRLTDPYTLLAGGMVTVLVSALVGVGASALVGSLGRSLRATEQALAERDQTNAELEHRVAERTSALEQAVARIQASEARFQTIIQTALDGFWIIDLQKRFIDVNDAYCAMSGYSRAEILGMQIPDVEMIERVEEVESRIRRIVATGSERFETRHRRKDGSLLDLEVSVTSIAGGNGEMICFCRDITARNLDRQALERQLAVQAAVARCSQMLLQPAQTGADQHERLADVIATLRPAIRASHLSLAQNFDDPAAGLCMRVFAGVAADGISFDPEHPALQHMPWQMLPARLWHTFAAGDLWVGPAASLFDSPGGPLQLTMEAFAINSVLCMPIFVEQSWWGLLVFADGQADRAWDSQELLLLQMAAELIGTAIQRWQTEADLGLQLRYAEALARCSQLLLQPAAGDAERQAVLGAALTALREAVSVGWLYIFQPPTNPLGEAGLRLLVNSRAPDLMPYIEPSLADIMDTPEEMQAALQAGRWFGGPVPGRFPRNPRFQQSLDENGVQSIVMVPIMLGGGLWGVLSAIDRVQLRDWDTPTLQLLRTAAEMIATFQQGWEAAAALRAREHFIQRVTEMSPDIVHVLDLATQRSLFLNRSLDAWLDHPAEAITEIRPELMQQLIHPDDTARVLAHYADLRAAADGQVAEQEFRVRTHDGRERWIVSRDLVFARDEHGQPSQILSIVQDITAGKRTEQALAASEARLRALRDALPDLLFIVRADGTFLEFYPPRQDSLLVPPETFLGQTIAAVLPPEVAQMAMLAIEKVRASGGIELLEYALSIHERTTVLESRVVPIIADELLFVVRDITERRQATSELLRAKDAAEAADRAKSTFLAHISHEIRTPLTAIIGMASLLRNTSLSPQQDEFVRTIRTGAETLLSIIGTILDFSKIEAGQMTLTVLPFDLRACLSEARALVVHQAHSKGLTLEYAVAPAVPRALAGDGGRLRQVLVNLLINAVKFTERGAVMLLASGRPLAEDGYELTIRISDTGIGIAAEHLPDIFDPFVQVDSTPTRRYGGTGLGLAISKQLVTLMGGQITVASTPSAGSTFTLTLPLRIAATPPAALDPTRAPGEPTAQRPLRVLLAEDNLINQEVLRRLLEHLGHLPDVVANGAAALAAVCRQPYDVVLMDIQMPELDGEEATRRIRALAGIRQPTIIALTASALRGDRERYLAGGMDDYLSKPVQVDDLRAALDRAGADLAPAPARPDPGPAQPRAQGPAPDLVDWALVDRMLAAIGGAPGQSLGLMQELFATTLAAQMTEIAAAIAAADRALVRLLAHKLRGGSQQLGAARLAACWAALEAAALADGGPLAERLDQARHVYDATLALIRARQGAVPPPASDSPG